MKLGDVRLSTIAKFCDKRNTCGDCPFYYLCAYMTVTPDNLDFDIHIDERKLI